MITRGQNTKPYPLNIVGSSNFGRYNKISAERTYNMFMSDSFMIPYAGYYPVINQSVFNSGKSGRGAYNSIKFNRLVLVIDSNVWFVNISYDTATNNYIYAPPVLIGQLNTSTGVVYIVENNKPQLVISDNTMLYIYDPAINSSLQPYNYFNGGQVLSFIPGYITFHDNYILVAASNDIAVVNAPANNTWRLSAINDATTFPNDSSSIGLLQTKPDNTQAVVRFPSKGNMIFVMGRNVTEAWFDTGAQLFPYQRNNQFNIDYGCLNPATVAYMDELVVWLAANERSGAVIMYSNGGMPKPISTDGIDYLFSLLTTPQDSQAFLYRQDGHVFYHINFYTDNLSLMYDFNTQKIYNACDQNLNYFIAAEVAYFNNQYYFVSKNTGNLYAFDTTYYTYSDTDANNNVVINEIPRFRICGHIRTPDQDYGIINDIGFTIETGETDYQQQSIGPIYLITQDSRQIVTQGDVGFFVTQDNNFIITQNGEYLVSQQPGFIVDNLIAQQSAILYITPRVDLSMSYDGGASFGNEQPYVLNPIGKRRNRLMWWQQGINNDAVPMFKFWGVGRVVCTDGMVHVRY
jgi:hypothetical protein